MIREHMQFSLENLNNILLSALKHDLDTRQLSDNLREVLCPIYCSVKDPNCEIFIESIYPKDIKDKLVRHYTHYKCSKMHNEYVQLVNSLAKNFEMLCDIYHIYPVHQVIKRINRIIESKYRFYDIYYFDIDKDDMDKIYDSLHSLGITSTLEYIARYEYDNYDILKCYIDNGLIKLKVESELTDDEFDTILDNFDLYKKVSDSGYSIGHFLESVREVDKFLKL